MGKCLGQKCCQPDKSGFGNIECQFSYGKAAWASVWGWEVPAWYSCTCLNKKLGFWNQSPVVWLDSIPLQSCTWLYVADLMRCTCILPVLSLYCTLDFYQVDKRLLPCTFGLGNGFWLLFVLMCKTTVQCSQSYWSPWESAWRCLWGFNCPGRVLQCSHGQ